MRVGVVQPGEEKAVGRPYYIFPVYKGDLKDGERIFTRVCSERTRSNDFKLKEGRFRLDIKEEFFYSEDGETLEQAAQRSGGCPIIRSVQDQVGWGFEQPDLVIDVPPHGREVGLGYL